MTFFVVSMAIMENQSFSMLEQEICIESVIESENPETESISDLADLVKSSAILEMYHKTLSISDESFVFFTLTQDIFRPPRLV